MVDSSIRALFRFSIVSQVVARMHRGERRAQAVQAVANGWHHQLGGAPCRVSERSIQRWLKAYEQLGMVGLEPTSSSSARAAILPKKLIDFLAHERDGDEHASIPELIRRARERGIVGPDDAVCRTTVYRTFRRLGISVARRKRASERDARRFAYPHRMDMVLSDGKHFRAGAGRMRRLAMFFLDDATRAGLHIVVGTSETAALFQRGLFECICRFGFMRVFYLDHGPGFIAKDTVTVIKDLGILLIHGEKAYPEGHGKIERFHLTAIGDVLRNLDGRPDVDPDCRALELRLQHYLRDQYGHRPHESLQGATPWQRFHGDTKALRFPESQGELRRKFEVWIERRVSADAIVSIDSVLYELPRGYGGQRVTLRRRLLDGSIGFLHQGQLIDLHPADLEANARAHRAKAKRREPDVQATPPPSAADLAYQREFGPVVDVDGGFQQDDPSED
jgi:putative transposase